MNTLTRCSSDVVAFRDVNLRIKAGQVVMLCGRTGR